MQANYRHILQSELDARMKRNPAYSMRAFAKDIGVKPPHLCSILNGQKGLSAASAARVAEAIGMNAGERFEFISLVNAQHARKSSTRKAAQIQVAEVAKSKSFKAIDLEYFKTIADWHNGAILHLLELSDFEPSVEWISKRLGIDKLTVRTALQRLEKLKLIDTSATPWRLNQKFSATPNVPSRAIRHHLHQGLSNAGQALETHPGEERDFSSLIMAIDKEALPEAKIWLKEFRRNFCQKLDQSPKKNAIYNLSIQFYELTKRESK